MSEEISEPRGIESIVLREFAPCATQWVQNRLNVVDWMVLLQTSVFVIAVMSEVLFRSFQVPFLLALVLWRVLDEMVASFAHQGLVPCGLLQGLVQAQWSVVLVQSLLVALGASPMLSIVAVSSVLVFSGESRPHRAFSGCGLSLALPIATQLGAMGFPFFAGWLIISSMCFSVVLLEMDDVRLMFSNATIINPDGVFGEQREQAHGDFGDSDASDGPNDENGSDRVRVTG